MSIPPDYEERVYAGVLGKVSGVYAGRPIEGASCRALLDRFGEVGHYLHEQRGVPLVVSDDDISGTLTFIRALEDSGLYADTPADFYGQTWLNYLIPGKMVLYHSGATSSLSAEMLCQSGTGGPGGASPLMKEPNSPAKPTI